MITVFHKDLSRAVSHVSSFLTAATKVRELLFDAQTEENKILLCYSDGRNTFVERIDAVVTDPVYTVVSIEKLQSIVDKATGSKGLDVDPVSIEVVENVMTVQITKRYGATYATSMVGKVVSKIAPQIVVKDPNENRMYGLLTRNDYVAMLTPKEECDTWVVGDLRKCLARLSAGLKGVTAGISYVLPKLNNAFASNNRYLTLLPLAEGYAWGFTMYPTTTNALQSAIASMGAEDKVFVKTEDKHCTTILNEAQTLAMTFEIAKSVAADVQIFNTYREREITELRFAVSAAAAQEVLSTVDSMLDAGSRQQMRITQDNEGKFALNFDNKGAYNTSLAIESSNLINKSENELKEIFERRIGIATKSLLSILSAITGSWLLMSLEKSADNAYILCITDMNEDNTVAAKYYMSASNAE